MKVKLIGIAINSIKQVKENIKIYSVKHKKLGKEGKGNKKETEKNENK